MGKGRIVSGGVDGLYNVEVLVNREHIDAELNGLAAKIAELNEELAQLEADLAVAEDERNAAATAVDQKVAEHLEEDGEGAPDVEAELAALAQASAQVQIIDGNRAMMVGRILSLEKRKEALQGIPENPTQQAWCADFTEDLAGDVATVEVPAEGVTGQFATWRRLQIRPGHAGAAAYSTARDGQLYHRAGQSPEQAFFNAAVLPGVQKWRPQYRIGTVTAIDTVADTCSLVIQGEDSSAQSLLIDPPNSQYAKAGVPIEYMDCNAQAFEVGDRVLVEFQGRGWDHPKVIGFESNPRECSLTEWIFYGLKPKEYGEYASGGPEVVADKATWVGTSSNWVSIDSVETRKGGNLAATAEFDAPDTQPSDPENLVEALEVSGLTEEMHRIGFYTRGFTSWLTATLSGTQVGTAGGLPIYDTMVLLTRSPAFVQYANVVNRFALFGEPGAETDGSNYLQSWSREFHADDNPTIEGSLHNFKVIGWVEIDQREEITNEPDGTERARWIFAKAVLQKIATE